MKPEQPWKLFARAGAGAGVGFGGDHCSAAGDEAPPSRLNWSGQDA